MSELQGSYVCPICGADQPHAHPEGDKQALHRWHEDRLKFERLVVSGYSKLLRSFNSPVEVLDDDVLRGRLFSQCHNGIYSDGGLQMLWEFWKEARREFMAPYPQAQTGRGGAS